MRTIAVVNQKGGCGKTTVSINLASALADLGKKTLLIDMDSQSHCAVGLAVPEDQIEQSIYDVLISESRNEPMRLSEILWQITDNMHLAPASIDLAAFEQQMSGIEERESCLMKVLKNVEDDFEYCVIDCPPAVSLLTFNALRAASDVVVPVETGYFALHGLSKQLETLSILCQRSNQEVNVRVVASMYDIRTKMAREILSELRNHFSDKMYKTVVNFNTKIKEAASFGQPVSEYDPSSKGKTDFKNLAEEVIESEAKSHTHELVNSLSTQLEAISSSAEELLREAHFPGVKREETKEKIRIQEHAPAKSPSKAPVPVTANAPSGEMEMQAAAKPEPAPAPQPMPESEPQPQAIVEHEEKTAEQRIEDKISDYYGVSQVNEAVMFVSLYPTAQNVQIAGDFNNWNPEKSMEKIDDSGIWQTKMNLSPGKYRYRYVVDGHWQQDPYNPKAEMNPYGEFNSILEVK